MDFKPIEEAHNFKDQAYEYLVNDVLRNNWRGDFFDHVRKYGMYEKIDEYAFEEKWSAEKKRRITEEVIRELKKEYLASIEQELKEQILELEVNKGDIQYYVEKQYLHDDTITADDDLSDEAIAKYIASYEKDIRRIEPIIATLETIVKQLNE